MNTHILIGGQWVNLNDGTTTTHAPPDPQGLGVAPLGTSPLGG